MIEVTVAYPAGQGRTFNMDYYLKTHIPLFQKRIGAAIKTIRVSRGIGGSTPRAPAAFVAMVHATFDSAEVFASSVRSATETERSAGSLAEEFVRCRCKDSERR
jgi:uncharacterized protein (TIGR02118 family)